MRFSFTLTETLPLHACSVTRNLCTYFTSVLRVFLIETVVVQTALWKHLGVERPFSSLYIYINYINVLYTYILCVFHLFIYVFHFTSPMYCVLITINEWVIFYVLLKSFRYRPPLLYLLLTLTNCFIGRLWNATSFPYIIGC